MNALQRVSSSPQSVALICKQFNLMRCLTTKVPQELSNRQKFKQIQPPIKLYEKLERLGFGTLLKTKRFSGLHKQKKQRQEQKAQYTERVGPPPEPEYTVSSFCYLA